MLINSQLFSFILSIILLGVRADSKGEGIMTEADFVESWMRFLTSVPSCPYRILLPATNTITTTTTTTIAAVPVDDASPSPSSSSSQPSEDNVTVIDDKDYYVKVVRRIDMLASGALGLPNYSRNEA